MINIFVAWTMATIACIHFKWSYFEYSVIFILLMIWLQLVDITREINRLKNE
jgi:bacteriorhodopsin